MHAMFYQVFALKNEEGGWFFPQRSIELKRPKQDGRQWWN